MTPMQIDLVRQSWAQVVPIQETAAGLFYDRVFTLDPTLRPLFKGDMRTQGRKLMAALAFLVNSLDRLDDVLPTLRPLAVRHAGWGVQPGHYDTVGAALLWTLRQGLGERFTPTMHQAWALTYERLADAMKSAAYGGGGGGGGGAAIGSVGSVGSVERARAATAA